MYMVKTTCTHCGRDSSYPNTTPPLERYCPNCPELAESMKAAQRATEDPEFMAELRLKAQAYAEERDVT